MMSQRRPFLDRASREFRTLCENHLDLIKVNPDKWFTDTWEKLRISDLYECYGVLSLTDQPLTNQMWDEYGGSLNCGFCVGWEAVELARALDDIALGKIWYQDEAMVHSFVNSDIKREVLKQFVKRKKYSFEAEWRFITPEIEHDGRRKRVFDPGSVCEVILDDRMPFNERNTIVTVLREVEMGITSFKPLIQTLSHRRGQGSYKPVSCLS